MTYSHLNLHCTTTTVRPPMPRIENDPFLTNVCPFLYQCVCDDIILNRKISVWVDIEKLKFLKIKLFQNLPNFSVMNWKLALVTLTTTTTDGKKIHRARYLFCHNQTEKDSQYMC